MEVTEDSREDFIHDQLIETSNDNPFLGSYWHKGGFQSKFVSTYKLGFRLHTLL